MVGQTVVKAWGNGQGVRLSKKILEAAGIALDDVLQVETGENCVILRKKIKHRTFEERLAEYDGEISVSDFDWGEPAGRELI